MWELFCNTEAEVWCAYDVDNSSMHILLDSSRGLFDPDPKIPQFVIDAWRRCQEAGYRAGISQPGCGAVYQTN